MAGTNEVTLTFAGDSAKLEQAFDKVGDAASKMDRKVRDSADSLDDQTSRVGALGERADSAETSLIGVHDVIDGTAAIMAGPGEAGLVAYIQGWADLAGGIAPLLLQMASLRLATIKQTVAQWASNAAFLASPITWIVLGIGLLIAAVVLTATKTDWFQRGWKAAWGGIKAAAGAVADWFRGPFVGFFQGAWNTLTGLPGKLRDAFSKVTGFLFAPFRAAFNSIARAWNSTVGRLSWSVPGWVPGIGGNSLSAPRLPTFHTGGMVPGAPGQEMLAVLTAGERVLPPGRAGGNVVELHISGSGSAGAQFMEDVRTGRINLSVRGGRVVVA
jgi:hypothetical protein